MATRTAVPGGEPGHTGRGPTAKRRPVKKYHLHPFITQFFLNPRGWTAAQHLEVMRDRVARAGRELEEYEQDVATYLAASAEGEDYPAPELSLPTEAWHHEHQARNTNLAEGVLVPPLREVLENLS